MPKTYLGDAVYLDYDEVRGMLVLTTEDGIQATNTTLRRAAVSARGVPRDF